MNILILGSGGREHAFAWKIAQSSSCNKLIIAPGNAGTNQLGTNIDININDFDAVKDLVLSYEIDMVLVGPEAPLVNGIYDFFQQDEKLSRISLIGPSAMLDLLSTRSSQGKHLSFAARDQYVPTIWHVSETRDQPLTRELRDVLESIK